MGIRSYWKEIQSGSKSPMFMNRLRQRGWLISILARTLIYCPRHSLFGGASTCLTLPNDCPIASTFALFIQLIGRLWICIQKEALSNLASSIDFLIVGLYRRIRYLSNDQGCWERILCCRPSRRRWLELCWSRDHGFRNLVLSAACSWRFLIGLQC